MSSGRAEHMQHATCYEYMQHTTAQCITFSSDCVDHARAFAKVPEWIGDRERPGVTGWLFAVGLVRRGKRALFSLEEIYVIVNTHTPSMARNRP